MDTNEIKEINKFNRNVANELSERFGFSVVYEYKRNQTARFVFDNGKFSIELGEKCHTEFKKMHKIFCYGEILHCFRLDDKGENPYIDREFKRNCIAKMPVEFVYLPR